MSYTNELYKKIPELKTLHHSYGIAFTDNGHYLYWTKLNDNEIDTSNHILRPQKFDPNFLSKNEIEKLVFLEKYNSGDIISREAQDELYTKFEIKKGVPLSGLKIIELQRYTDILLSKVTELVNIIFRYDVQVSKILKVYCTESNFGYIEKMKSYGMKTSKLSNIVTISIFEIMDNLIYFFNELLLKGASFDDMQKKWLPKYLPKNDFISQLVYESTVFGVKHFLKYKESHLYDAYLIAQKLQSVSSLLDINLTGKIKFASYINNIPNDLRNDPQLIKLSELFEKRSPSFSKSELLIALNIIRGSGHVKKKSIIIRSIFNDNAWPEKLKDIKPSKKYYKRLDRLIEFYDNETGFKRKEI